MSEAMQPGVAVDLYVEEKKVKAVTPVEGEETPLGEPIFLITFEDDSSTKMTSRKFQSMQTLEKSDATSARNALTKDLGQQIYALMMEYGIKFAEIDPVLNEVVRLVNDGQNAALDILWGTDAYDRSLLDVNRVLLTKYGEESPENNDESAPEGGSADSEDAK